MEKLGREFRNKHYEISPEGVLFPRAHVRVGGYFKTEHMRGGKLLSTSIDPNTVVDEGLMSILSTMYNGGAQTTNWYIGIFGGNYTPVSTDTGAVIAVNATESAAYTQGVRQTWVVAAPASNQITNSASKATFTMNATTIIYGAFLISTSAISDTLGSLMSASKFAASRSVVAADELLIAYTISAANV